MNRAIEPQRDVPVKVFAQSGGDATGKTRYHDRARSLKGRAPQLAMSSRTDFWM